MKSSAGTWSDLLRSPVGRSPPDLILYLMHKTFPYSCGIIFWSNVCHDSPRIHFILVHIYEMSEWQSFDSHSCFPVSFFLFSTHLHTRRQLPSHTVSDINKTQVQSSKVSSYSWRMNKTIPGSELQDMSTRPHCTYDWSSAAALRSARASAAASPVFSGDYSQKMLYTHRLYFMQTCIDKYVRIYTDIDLTSHNSKIMQFSLAMNF